MLGREFDDRARNSIMLIERQQRMAKTLDYLINQGVPLREEKYKWTNADRQRLNEVALSLRNNTECLATELTVRFSCQ